MNRLFPLSILAVGLLAAPASPDAMATTGIMKCATPEGIAIYTDHACEPGAKAVPMPGQLLARIARDEARSPDATDGFDGDTLPVPRRRSVAAGCARTPTQLERDLRASIALGDVNRVAESYHWVGISTREGERVLDRLQRMAREPVVDTHYFDAAIPSSPLGVDAIQLASATPVPDRRGCCRCNSGGACKHRSSTWTSSATRAAISSSSEPAFRCIPSRARLARCDSDARCSRSAS
jgi:hypothetical protein